MAFDPPMIISNIMPYQIQVHAQIIRIILTGYVTKTEMIDLACETALLDANFGRTFDRLTDLSAVEKSDSDYETISSLAKERQKRIFQQKFRSAIVAPNPLDYGCARMFQTLSENPSVDRQIFKTMVEAELWLASNA